jgi:hypothetical protein
VRSRNYRGGMVRSRNDRADAADPSATVFRPHPRRRCGQKPGGIDNDILWDVVQHKVPLLARSVGGFLHP